MKFSIRDLLLSQRDFWMVILRIKPIPSEEWRSETERFCWRAFAWLAVLVAAIGLLDVAILLKALAQIAISALRNIK